MRYPELGTSTFFHVFNRGVDKRAVFCDYKDYQRFFESLYLFNDANYSRKNGRELGRLELVSSWEVNQHERVPLVQIVAYYLSANHFHLLMRQVEEEGISRFLHALSMGYAKYFNLKYDRSGALFEGAFKAVPTDFDQHLEHLPRYIHLNALDHSLYNWRDGKIFDWDMAIKILDSHQWSSHHTYMGREDILPIVDEKWVRDRFSTVDEYVHYLKEWAGRNALSQEMQVFITE